MTKEGRPRTEGAVSTKTRTYDEIYAEVTKVYTERAVSLAEGESFAQHADRAADLWDEIARNTLGDRDVPAWASLAVVLLRDQLRWAAEQWRRDARAVEV